MSERAPNNEHTPSMARLTRRRLLRLLIIGSGLGSLYGATATTRGSAAHTVLLPMAFGPAALPDGSILAAAGGTQAAAGAWFTQYATNYNSSDIAAIVAAYAGIGDEAGIDWFLALAQNGHETDQLRSWWSAAPRRNPAGIGVTGETQPGSPDSAPGSDWAWDENAALWRRGISFPDWAAAAVPAHLGRLLAYALPIGAGSVRQQQLIDQALSYRPLPSTYRGVARLITDLNGRWAVPGTTYGQSILNLRNRMRGG